MNYFGAAILMLFLLGLTSAGWYYLFKRFERRMSGRFDDLVARNEETMKGFADTIEILGHIMRELEILKVTDKKLDVTQGIALVIKQELFLSHARAIARAYRESGMIDGPAIEKFEKIIDEMKLENYSRY